MAGQYIENSEKKYIKKNIKQFKGVILKYKNQLWRE